MTQCEGFFLHGFPSLWTLCSLLTMLCIFHATSCLPPFNIAVARERELTNMQSRNSRPVSTGLSPARLSHLHYMRLWAIDEHTEGMCAFLRTRNHSCAALQPVKVTVSLVVLVETV